MKRLLSVLLVAVLLIACLPISAFAAGNASVSVGSAVAKAGDTVNITYTVSGEFANYELYVEFDDALTVQGINTNGEWGQPGGKYKVAFAKSSNIEKDFFTVSFKVADDAQPGKYAVKASVLFVSDADLVDQVVSVSNGTITIEAPTHVHDFNTFVETVAPTCTEQGYDVYKCSCDDTEKRNYTAALGHDMAGWVVVKEATCGEAGSKSNSCKRCDYSQEMAISATGKHTWGEWVVVKDATCYSAGERYHVCSVCGLKKTESIAMGKHNVSGKWEYNDHEHWHECSNAGCTVKVDVAKHTFKWVIDTPATENKTGIKHEECTVCGCTRNENTTIPMKDGANDNDDVVDMGDTTPYGTYNTMFNVVVIVALLTAVALLFKRKSVK